MSTPFEFFRRHQKVALAAVTGSAILSFVVFDASNANNISPLALSVLVIGCLALVGWIWGAGEGKSGENAVFGGVLGLAVSLMFMFLGRPPVAISANSGSISQNDLHELDRKRAIANRMVGLVFYGANPKPDFMAQFRYHQNGGYSFGFENGAIVKDLTISELLNREAESLGIQVTDTAVMNYLKEVAGKDEDGDDRLTRTVFSDAIKSIRQQFPGSSEDTVINAIRHEMQARQALNVLYGGERTTPLDIWDMHRKLNTRQSAQVVELPVSDFEDNSAEPSDAELKAFFEEYKKNYPNFTQTNQLEEGRPGLYLPRRVRLAYLEPVYEELEKQVGEITEEEIQKRYEERYQRQMPADAIHGELNLPDMPLLPNVPKASEDAPADPPAAETPVDSAPDTSAEPAPPANGEKPPEGEASADPATPAPAEAEVPASEPQPEAPASETPAPEQPAPPAEPKAEGTSLRMSRRPLYDVALIQDEAPATEAPATEAPATEAPATEAPLTVPPVEEAPAAGTDDDPPPPVSGIRPLDEPLRQRIRDELLAEKTRPLIEAKIKAADAFMDDLHLEIIETIDLLKKEHAEKQGVSADKVVLTTEVLTPVQDDVAQRLKEYATKNGLVYTETPLVPLDELAQSEDYPVAKAIVGQRLVWQNIMMSRADDIYSATVGEDFTQNTSFVYWKIEDHKAHEPSSLDEIGVKDAAVKAWRALKARDKVEKRAKELVELVTKSGKPMAEALSEETVTGEKDKSVFVSIKSTGEFSWLRQSSTPGEFGGQNSAPSLGGIFGVEKAGDSFMSKVFDGMKPGETAVVPNEDRSAYYVVQIEKRTPMTDSEVEVMRNQFLASQGELTGFAASLVRSRVGSVGDRLFEKHGVQISDALRDRNSDE